MLKWKPKVPHWSQKATQSTKETSQGLAKFHKDLKNMNNRPRPGARRRRRRSGHGSKGRPTRLHVETPVAEREQRIEVQVTRALFLYSNNWVLPLAPDFSPDPPRPTSTHTAAAIFRAFLHGGPKSENKRPQPQSDRAGAVQTMFATFYKNSKCHQNTARRAPQSDAFLVPFSNLFLTGAHRTPTWTPRVPK